MILVIQTIRPTVELLLLDEQRQMVARQAWQSQKDEVEKLFPALDTLLKEERVKQEDISQIVVYNGKGSFSSTRIGVTMANTLAFALGAELFELTAKQEGDSLQEVKQLLAGTPQPVKLAKPVYAAEPNITISDKNRV